ncbi:MAG: arylsulfatase A-like enzyme [Myxococcota bacterium]|jgi:arylsulfatase A-like enzyme
MNRGVLIGAGAVIATIALGAVGWQMSQSQRPKPNVLIVLWDTVRADRLTPYGYGKDTTPALDAWAKTYGVVFERAISPAMWTVPSHASMFTGLMPTTHGAGYDWRWLDTHNVTAAEHFQANGWDTYAFSANPNLSTGRVNLLQGFETVDLSWSRKWKQRVGKHTRKKLLKKDQSTEISPAYRGGASSTFSYNAAPFTHEALFAWVDGREGEPAPWFAYLNYMEAHKPRVPSLAARRKVADDETIRTGLRTDLTMKSQLEYSFYKKEYSQEELDAINAVYDASLVDLDIATKELFAGLESRDLMEDTIVVFTSDHGENLGEHNLFGHRHGVYQQLVHVPLIVSYPAKLKPGRVSEPVANLDIYSSLCDLAGIERPATIADRGNLFVSAAALAKNVFTESISVDRLGWDKVRRWFPDSFEQNPREQKFKAIVQGEWKLITATDDAGNPLPDETTLFNLDDDPEELKNLAAANPDQVAALTALLDEWKAALPVYDPSKQTEADRPKEDSAAMKKQLEMLGYLDEDEGGDDEAEGGDTDEPME